ncbi:MAG: methyltransferase family protein [Actinomycetes bacterium]
MTDAQAGVAPAADRRLAWSFVLVQFVLLGLVLLLPEGESWNVSSAFRRTLDVLVLAGIVLMVVAATALGRGLTAAPLPNQHARLRTGGAFRWVRHPIYTGLMLLAVARTSASGNPWVVAACVLLVLLLNVKARWEERQLMRRFPGYADYAERTGRFFPRLRGR